MLIIYVLLCYISVTLAFDVLQIWMFIAVTLMITSFVITSIHFCEQHILRDYERDSSTTPQFLRMLSTSFWQIMGAIMHQGLYI